LTISPKRVIIKSLNDCLPNATHVSIASNFNDSLDKLSHSITHLTFCESCTQPLNNLLTVTHITMRIYDEPIGFLPSLTYIKFGNRFNQPVDNLSNSLRQIEFSDGFNHYVDFLPSKITHLSFGEVFK
jgi:FNIP Repeat